MHRGEALLGTQSPRPRLGRCVHYILVAMVLQSSFGVSDGQDSRYLGCFYDSNTRVLSDLTKCETMSELCNNKCSVNVPYCQSGTNMSVSNCLRLCARQNHTYAGLQAGSQCFCGDRTASYDMYGEEPEDERCMGNCTGDASQSCGTDYRMQIYEIGCLPIAIPTNADLARAGEDFYAIGGNLSVACRPGYYLSGSGTLTCLSLGRWHAPPPSCAPDLCPRPDPPPGASVRGNQSLDAGYQGGDWLLFDCTESSNGTVMLTCVDGDWQADGICPELATTVPPTNAVTTGVTVDTTRGTTRPPSNHTGPEINPTSPTQDPTGGTSRPPSNHTVPEVNSTSPTQDTMDGTSRPPSNQTAPEINSTFPTEENTTLDVTELETWTGVSTSPTARSTTPVTPETSTRPFTNPLNLSWLILIVGTAMCTFLLIIFLAVLVVFRRKSKRNETPINFENELRMPRVEDMSRMNHAYEETERLGPNGSRHDLDPPFRISALYSQKEVTVDNGNGYAHAHAVPKPPGSPHNYAAAGRRRPPSPGGKGNGHVAPSRVHYMKRNGAAGGGDETPRGMMVVQLPASALPEPDYSASPRESYVEVVTRL